MDAKEIMRLSESGDYLRLIELTISIPDGKCDTFEEVYLRIQFALAYQHAGVYGTSLWHYEYILKKISGFKKNNHPKGAAFFEFEGVNWGDIRYNLNLQRAVLLERIERISEAREIFDKLPEPEGFVDLRIAKATLYCWYFSTKIRLCLRRHDYNLLASIAREPVNKSDKLVRLWARFAQALSTAIISKSNNFEQLEKLNSDLESFDPPGHPWFLLLEGQHLRNINLEFSTKAFQQALDVGKRLGRFFIIVSAAEGMYVNLKLKGGTDKDTLERYFLQQVRTLHLCQLITFDPYRQRLCKAATEDLGWDEAKFTKIFMKTQGMLRKKSDFQIGKMCIEHVKKGNPEPGEKDEDVFERFVCSWAENMFPHYIVERTPTAAPAVDIVCKRTRDGRVHAKFIQAKLWANPRDAGKMRIQRIKDAKQLLGVDEVEEYYFVVAKKGEAAWDDKKDWHIEDVKKLRETVHVDNIIPYTEPMLQTDIVEIPELQEYFNLSRE